MDIVDSLKQEIATLREELTGAGIDLERQREWKQEEERRKQRLADGHALAVVVQADREQAAKDQALRLWQAGSFVVDIGAPGARWKRAKPGKELTLRCPHCGSPLCSFPGNMANFYEAYQKYVRLGGSGGNLLDGFLPMGGLWWQGVPMGREGTASACENCKNPIKYRLQMILPVPGEE